MCAHERREIAVLASANSTQGTIAPIGTAKVLAAREPARRYPVEACGRMVRLPAW